MRFKILSLALCFLLAFSSFAEETPADPGTGETVVNVSIDNPAPYRVLVGTSVYAANPVTPADATGFKAVMLEFIGNYDAVIVEHQYEDANGNISYEHSIQIDYAWIVSALFLLVVLYCILKAGGGLLCR